MAQVFDELPPDWNLCQQVHCNNAAANVVGQLSGTQASLQKEAEARLAKHVPEIPGSWEVAWGPAMYKTDANNDKTGPTNVWYAAVSKNAKTCVLAVAGTAKASWEGWWGDILVKETVLFDEWTQKWKTTQVPDPQTTKCWPGDERSFCSQGTANFVRNILNMVSPSSAASAGTTIGSFLAKIQNSGYGIVFTGHSLGGAVSPALAHGLVQAKILNAQGVSVLPTAGASPGNAAWNKAFSNHFPSSGSGYQAFNSLFFNHLDIVPQAWSAKVTDDRNIPNINQKIYTNLEPPLKGRLQTFVKFGMGLSKYGMDYAPLPGSAFTGDAIPDDIKDDNDLVKQWGKQHSPEYWKEIGIQTFVDKLTSDKPQPGVEPLPHAPDFQHSEGAGFPEDALQDIINEMEAQLQSPKEETATATHE